MIDPLVQRLKTAASNKHTTLAGIVYLGAYAIEHLGSIWFPEAKPKLSATAETIRNLAVGYGLIMGADAGKKDVDSDSSQKQSPPP